MLRVTNLNLKLAVVFIPLAIKVINMMMSVSNWSMWPPSLPPELIWLLFYLCMIWTTECYLWLRNHFEEYGKIFRFVMCCVMSAPNFDVSFSMYISAYVWRGWFPSAVQVFWLFVVVYMKWGREFYGACRKHIYYNRRVRQLYRLAMSAGKMDITVYALEINISKLVSSWEYQDHCICVLIFWFCLITFDDNYFFGTILKRRNKVSLKKFTFSVMRLFIQVVISTQLVPWELEIRCLLMIIFWCCLVSCILLLRYTVSSHVDDNDIFGSILRTQQQIRFKKYISILLHERHGISIFSCGVKKKQKKKEKKRKKVLCTLLNNFSLTRCDVFELICLGGLEKDDILLDFLNCTVRSSQEFSVKCDGEMTGRLSGIETGIGNHWLVLFAILVVGDYFFLRQTDRVRKLGGSRRDCCRVGGGMSGDQFKSLSLHEQEKIFAKYVKERVENEGSNRGSTKKRRKLTNDGSNRIKVDGVNKNDMKRLIYEGYEFGNEVWHEHSDSINFSNKLLRMRETVAICAADIRRVRQQNWLTDNAMAVGCSIANDTLMKDESNTCWVLFPAALSRGKIGRRLHIVEKMYTAMGIRNFFLTLNVNSDHWLVLRIDIDDKNVVLYNSLKNNEWPIGGKEKDELDNVLRNVDSLMVSTI